MTPARSREAGVVAAIGVGLLVLLLGLVAQSPVVAFVVGVLLFIGVTVIAPRAASSSLPWWSNPAWLMILGLLPGLTLTLVRDDNAFVERWGAPKFINVGDVL